MADVDVQLFCYSAHGLGVSRFKDCERWHFSWCWYDGLQNWVGLVMWHITFPIIEYIPISCSYSTSLIHHMSQVPNSFGAWHWFYWLRDEADKGRINVVHLPTEEMPADILTKALSRVKVGEMVDMLGLWAWECSCWGGVLGCNKHTRTLMCCWLMMNHLLLTNTCPMEMD